MKERKLEDMCVVCDRHGDVSCGYEERGLQVKCHDNDLIERGYELAQKDITAMIESRISEILGDAQPAPVLRMELQGIIDKIQVQ